MKALKLILVVAAMSVLPTVASAEDVYLNNQVDWSFDADGDSTTMVFQEFGYSGTLATSVYYDDPTSTLTKVIDTNIDTELAKFGMTAGTHTAIDTTTSVTLSTVANDDQKNLDSLNSNAAVIDTEGYGDSLIPPLAALGNWYITYDYYFVGNTTATGVEFTDGEINFFYTSADGNNSKQIMQMEVNKSLLTPANLFIFGEADYDFDNDGTDDAIGDPFIQDFLTFANDGTTAYDNWFGNITMAFELDTNVNPPIPSANQLVEFNAGVASTAVDGTAIAAGDDFFIRQTTLDGSLKISRVPEPNTLALLGLGLLSFGVGKMRKKTV